MAKKTKTTEKPKTGRAVKKAAKKVTGGKTAKKAAANKPVKKAVDTEQKSLAKELRSLIPKLDSEGLSFLVKQARVHLYNMQVAALNKAAKAANAAAARSRSVAEKPRSPGKSKSVKENLSIKGTESGSSYYLYYQNANVMFSRGEMAHLVKITNTGGTDFEIRERLYSWFKRERKDIFATVPIADKFDDRLKTLAALIKKSFKLRGGA